MESHREKMARKKAHRTKRAEPVIAEPPVSPPTRAERPIRVSNRELDRRAVLIATALLGGLIHGR